MSAESTCKSCGQPLPADGAFCSQCGSHARDTEKTVLAARRIREGTSLGQPQCESCNSLLGVGDIYCRFCGAKSDRDAEGSDGPTEEPAPDAMLERLVDATAGEFEIIKRLGKGGMGSVYLARESALQRYVAIKVLAAEFLADATVLERFRTEARIVATLRHRSIVVIHAVRHAEDLHYFVMDYVEGATLRDVIKSHGPLPTTVVKAVLYEVGSALTYTHGQGGGIIHRDIKPANIMLDSEGAVVVMDYGISKAVGAKAGLTMDGSLIGTPEYMSPEQCRGNVLTGASDQYALGLLGYAMLAGAPPFSGSQWVVIASQIGETPPHITEIRPDCPQDLADSIHRMLAKVPDERWPSISDALKAFGGRPHDVGDPVREEAAALVHESEGATRVEIPVSRLEFEAPSEDVEPGDEILLTAEAFDDLGRVLSGRRISWSTSDPNVIAVSSDAGTVMARAPGSALITAAIGQVGTSLELTVREPSPASITLDPGALQLHSGEQAVLVAVVKDRRANPVPGNPRWSASDGNVVSVSQTGQVEAQNPGAAIVTAEIEGLQATAEVTVGLSAVPTSEPSGETLPGRESELEVEPRVGGLPVAAVHIAAPPFEVRVGDRFELQAIAVDTDGDVRRTIFEWQSSDPVVASVTPSGEVNATSVGAVEITATVDGVDASVHLTITQALATAGMGGRSRWLMILGGLALPIVAVVTWQQFAGANDSPSTDPIGVETASVTSVDIVPPSEAVQAGDTVRLSATVLDGDGASVSVPTVDWRVDNPGVVTVDQDGVLVAGIAGNVRVFAVIDGVEGFIDLLIGPTPSSAGNDEVVEQPTVASIDNAGVDDNEPDEEVELSLPTSAAVPEIESTAIESAVTEPAVIASISLTLADRRMDEGSSQAYRVEIHDSGGAQLPQIGRAISVRSNSPSVVVQSASGQVTASAPGSAYLIVTAGDVVDSVQVIVRAGVASVVIRGVGGRLAVNASLFLQAEAHGTLDQLLAGRTIEWSSTDPAVLTVDWTGRVIAIAPGSAEVIASSEGVEGRITLVVEGVPL